MKKREYILVSACLLGINCRYDGGSKYCEKINKLSEKYCIIPVCPEQLGGLPTPRTPASFVNNRLFSHTGNDVTEYFERGARETLKISKLFGVKKAVFKEKSPSCGVNKVYFRISGKDVLKSGSGITTQLLKKNGIDIISEEVL